MAEEEALAVTISALLLMPEAVEALKQMILVAWAGGESVMDLRCLLDGRKVPLEKVQINGLFLCHSCHFF